MSEERVLDILYTTYMLILFGFVCFGGEFELGIDTDEIFSKYEQ